MSLAAILLAAGASTRFAGANKLLAPLNGVPLVRHVAKVLCASNLDEIIAVTGPDAEDLTTVLSGLPIRFAHNATFADGMGSSIACGIRALPADCDGAFIVPGDMPKLSTALLVQLAEAFTAGGMSSPVYPARGDGTQSPPVLWPRSAFAALAKLSGPFGGKSLLADLGGTALTVTDDTLLADVDTVADLDRLQALDGA